MANKPNSDRHSIGVLLALLFFIFLFIILRNVGLYPSVFADEYTYSKFARLIPVGEATIPGYLYYKIYGVTKYCGDGFLGCAKIFNAAFFVVAAPFIFFLARRVSSSAVSVAVALLAVSGPINSYTAYFMPESLYFLGFWVFCWLLLNIKSTSDGRYWLAVGVIYGLTSLVKPHSMLFLPAVLLYIFYLFYSDGKLKGRQSYIAIVLFGFGALLTKISVGYLLAGQAGATLFGDFYGSIAAQSSTDVDRYFRLLALAYENIKGHIMVLALIYGLPIALAISAVVQRLFVNRVEKEAQCQSVQLERIGFFSLVVVLNLVVVVALFTALVANSGPYESPYRLHMRYYNFALPLFYIVAAGSFSSIGAIRNGRMQYFLGVVIGAIAIYAFVTNMTPFIPSHVDSPEVRGIHANDWLFRIFGVLSVSALCAWVVLGACGIRIYFFLALPLFVLVSTYFVTVEQKSRLVQDVYDKAGLFTKQYLAPEDLSKIVVAGSEPSGLFRSLFYLDNPNASLDVLSRGSEYVIGRLPEETEWVLLIGDYQYPDNTLFQLPINGFTLVRVARSNIIDFKKSIWPGQVDKVQGLSITEQWGTWSTEKSINIEFAMPLPERFKVTLFAHAFGPNIGKEYIATVGGSVSRFMFPDAADKEIVLNFSNPGRSRVLNIEVPYPVSPKSLGISGDDRNLGIGLVWMNVEAQ